MKLVFIEPNLVSTTGHVFEATRAIDNYLYDLDYEYYIVCNQAVNHVVLDSFSKLYPLASQTCFSSDNYSLVKADIQSICQRFALTQDDVIVFMTAHFNELKAVLKWVSENQPCSPQFVLQIHQYYPPTKVTDEIFTPENMARVDSIYHSMAAQLGALSEYIHILTTPVDELRQKLAYALGCEVQSAPVPFNPLSVSATRQEGFLSTVGFVGDGRKEKGLLPFLEVVLLGEDEHIKYVIQLQNVRGLNQSQKKKFKFLMKQLSQKQNVKFITKSLNSTEYYKLLEKIDVLVIPYEPEHYSCRLSAIGVEAGMLGVPVLASIGTSTARWVDQGLLVGITFKYDSDDIHQTAVNILTGVDQLVSSYSELMQEALLKRDRIQEEFSARNYLTNYILPLTK